jgi:TPP-dependent pyruvate/acetoin dehydrogenase alpha subunit
MEKLSRDIKVKMYKQMLLIRSFEVMVKKLLEQARIKGTAHLYIGQEAVAVGACSALRGDDYITSTHRGHGHCIAKGARVDRMMAELFGKVTGYCHGKGGSMHIADMDTYNLGANGIVGGSIPIATGAGLSIKMRESSQVVCCFLGDASTNQGSFHESLNLASIWDLPVIYLCENNFYGISSYIKDAMKVKNVADRMAAYKIPSEIVDGNDVMSVFDAVNRAASYCRSGKGPYFLECVTYRWEGHSRSDPCVYRTAEEKNEWVAKCPIKRLEKLLIEEGLDQKELSKIRSGVENEIESAVEFAQNQPDPVFSELYKDLYYKDIV